MIILAAMKFLNFKKMPKYHKISKLCEENLIPFIWGGMEGAEQAILKGIFRPYSTELHRLFEKYTKHKVSHLLGLDEWKKLCLDVLNQDNIKNAWSRGGKPTETDIDAAYLLSLEDGGFDLELTYKYFEKALSNLAQKIYKKQPKQNYASLKYHDKVKKLLKWAVKLEKSGYAPNLAPI